MISAANDHRRLQPEAPQEESHALRAAEENSPRRAAGSHNHQPTRINSFLRQNHNSPARKILVPTLYIALVVVYFRGLLLRDVGSGIDVIRENVDVDATESTAPIWRSTGGSDAPPETARLEPRSLADVTIANAEVTWKRREDYRTHFLRRAEIGEEERRKREDARRAAAEEEREKGATARGREVMNATEQRALLNAFNSSSIDPAEFDAEEYVKRLASLSVRRTPKRRKMVQGEGGDLGFLPVFFVITTCTLFRVIVNVLVGRFAGFDPADLDSDGEDDANIPPSRRRGGLASFSLLSGGRDAARLRRRRRTEHARRQFQRFVDRLNAEREANGERRISADTLRHLANGRDFDGNDYDRLYSFVEENGPAMGSIFSAIGATEAEISRCPSRTLGDGDELLRPRRGAGGEGQGQSQGQSCSVCLEPYQVGETVRTIPCFHTFHTACIDPWLAQRAECPVCKHSAIG